MQCLEVSGAVRPIYGSLGVKWLIKQQFRKYGYAYLTERQIREIHH